jgi:Zc3h12a-like Ribonuclease NYN domain/S1 RNA binding domain
MTSGRGPAHVVVDGSNIATEGRSLPSLAQLSEAVMSFMEEHPDTAITVVVDATFGHRIDKKEVKEFEEGIANNELVAPPAGAVGRGDAFVLAIAQKSNAAILSNDSFQEFHADYEWLFDEGRLIGGKPVPHVGWVFVDRVPVRGPVSRKATSKGGSRRGAKKEGAEPERRSGRKASDAASQPMPVPKTPPPGRSPKSPSRQVAEAEVEAVPAASRPSVPKAGDTVNELMPFLEFVEHHPVGTSVNGTVESYSSHGAYISIGENGVRGYVPLRLMADPAPPSARKVMKLGESVTVVVVSFAPLRRSIDCALPDMAQAAIAAAREEQAEELAAEAPSRRRAPRKSAAEKPAADTQRDDATAPAGPSQPAAAARKQAAKKAPAKKAPARKAPARKAPAKKAPAKKAAAKKAAADIAPAKKAPAKKAPAKKQAAPTSGADGS